MRSRGAPNPRDAYNAGMVPGSRALLALMLAMTCCLDSALAADAASAVYPNRPIRFVVPFAAGGPSDVMARTLAQKMTRDLARVQKRIDFRQMLRSLRTNEAGIVQ